MGQDAAVIATSRAWAAAIVSNDAARIAAFMTDDWMIVSESGIASKPDFLAMIASGDLTHSAMDTVGEPLVRFHDGTAILTARVTNTAHYRGQRFDADEWTTDIFVQHDNHWLCAHSHITPTTPT